MNLGRSIVFIWILCIPCSLLFGQSGTLKGKVVFNDKPVAYANVSISKLGVSTNAEGLYEIKNIPEGTYKLTISGIGYETKTIQVTIKANEISVINVAMQEAFFALNAVVVTGTRTERRRLESPVAVNVLDSKTFNITQSNSLAEGLCFQPGLRMETDCQTCNYTQLRMNGLGGSYSQILINSRPVFTSLMSLYGLDQIPANMIDRVEIVRGGGSVLYGSNAIAGTVNILTKEPLTSSFTISNNASLIGGKSFDNFLNANATVVNDGQNAGVSFFASHRDRNAYDANDDGYSEISQLINNSFGFNSFLKLDAQSKLEVNGWSIYEQRRGGNRIDEQADRADQSEYRLHNILVGGVNYQRKAKNDRFYFSIYGSAQNTKRTHYTGVDHIDAWGHTKNFSFQEGIQLNYRFNNFLKGKNTLTTGMEDQYEYTFDQVKIYNYLIDQKVNLLGVFLQSDWDVTKNLSVLSGIRINNHSKVKKPIFTPRISMVYKLGTTTQLRLAFAKGFKAPQAFETDMHMAFANGGVSIIRIDPTLKEETSNSVNASVDFNKANEELIYGFTLDAFYTTLKNAFVLEKIGTDSAGNQKLVRKNGGYSVVRGITCEGRLNYNQKFQLETGITFQRSTYANAIAWSNELPGSRQYLRTPNVYGYYTLTILPRNRFNASLSGVLTGSMKVPHFAGAPEITQDVVNTSQTFFENNIKLSYNFTLKNIKQDVQISTGVQNIFNQYQSDFDTGKNRDSNYIYGPSRPRTFFVAIKFGLL